MKLVCKCGSRNIELEEILPSKLFPSKVVLVYVCQDCKSLFVFIRPRSPLGQIFSDKPKTKKRRKKCQKSGE
jgi:hypothetical protein